MNTTNLDFILSYVYSSSQLANKITRKIYRDSHSDLVGTQSISSDRRQRYCRIVRVGVSINWSITDPIFSTKINLANCKWKFSFQLFSFHYLHYFTFTRTTFTPWISTPVTSFLRHTNLLWLTPSHSTWLSQLFFPHFSPRSLFFDRK